MRGRGSGGSYRTPSPNLLHSIQVIIPMRNLHTAQVHRSHRKENKLIRRDLTQGSQLPWNLLPGTAKYFWIVFVSIHT